MVFVYNWFESLHTNITVVGTMRNTQKLCLEFQNVIPNAQFIIELLELALSNSSWMIVEDETFNKCLILLWELMLHPFLQKFTWCCWRKCKRDPKLIWPKLIWPILAQRSKEDEAWYFYRFSWRYVLDW